MTTLPRTHQGLAGEAERATTVRSGRALLFRLQKLRVNEDLYGEPISLAAQVPLQSGRVANPTLRVMDETDEPLTILVRRIPLDIDHELLANRFVLQCSPSFFHFNSALKIVFGWKASR